MSASRKGRRIGKDCTDIFDRVATLDRSGIALGRKRVLGLALVLGLVLGLVLRLVVVLRDDLLRLVPARRSGGDHGGDGENGERREGGEASEHD